MSFDFNEWYTENTKKDNVYSFSGILSEDKISNILDDIENKFRNNPKEDKVSKRIYYLAIESLQNLYHHAERDLNGESKSLTDNKMAFILNKENNENYFIITGNFVKRTNIRMLKERIDQLNFLSKDEVKVLYKLILNNEEFSQKGGGGLGMIDIVKRTGKSLSYNFYNFDKDYIFFSLRIAI
jgi:hypothetical protein